MVQFIKEALTSGSNKSSSRLINMSGFVVVTILLSYQTFTSGLTYDLFGVYMLYCAGVYTGGKYVGGKIDALNRDEEVYDTRRYDDKPPYN